MYHPLFHCGPVFRFAIVARSVRANVGLKWPNDLVFGGRKLGGILGESVVTSGQRWLVLGIGINVSRLTGDSIRGAPPITSVEEMCGGFFCSEWQQGQERAEMRRIWQRCS